MRRVLEDLQITVDKTYERRLRNVSHAHRLWPVATDAGVVRKRIRSWKEIRGDGINDVLTACTSFSRSAFFGSCPALVY